MGCFKQVNNNNVWTKVIYSRDGYIFLRELKNENTSSQFFAEFYAEFYAEEDDTFIDDAGTQHHMCNITSIGLVDNTITTLNVLNDKFATVPVMPRNQYEKDKIINYLNNHKCGF